MSVRGGSRPGSPGTADTTTGRGTGEMSADHEGRSQVATSPGRGGRPAFGGGFLSMIAPLVWDIGPAVGAYYLLRALGVDTYLAMLGGTAAAGPRVAYVAVRRRRFDGFAAFMVAVFAAGLVLSLIGGDARFMLVKDSALTGVAGLFFLGSVVARRPMVFGMLVRIEGRTPERLAELRHRWETAAGFRRTLMIMTAVWGVGLLIDAGARIPLIYLLPVDTATALSGLLQLACIGLLIAFTIIYRGHRERRARDPQL